MPDNPHPAGALVFPGSILSCSLILIIFIEFIRKGIRGIIRTQFILLFGIIYWVLSDVIQGLYPVHAEKDVINYTFIAIGLFAGCVILGSSVSTRLLPRSIYRIAYIEPRSRQLFNLIVICFLLGIFYYAYKSNFDITLMINGLTKGRFAAPWSRGRFGGWDTFIEHLSYFSYLLPVLTVWLVYINKSWLNVKVFIAVLLTLTMILFIGQAGSRSNVGAMVGSGLLFWVLIHIRKITITKILIIATVVISLLYTLNFMLEVRNTGVENLDNIEQKQGISTIHVDDNFLRIVQTIKYFPEYKDYAGMQWIIYALVRPVPRVFWPDKPDSSGVEINAVVQSYGASLSSSILGESYGAFGWFGIIGTGLFFGLLGSATNRILLLPGQKSAALIYSLCTMALFLGLRSLINLVLMTYPILALWFLTVIFRRQLFRQKTNVQNTSINQLQQSH